MLRILGPSTDKSAFPAWFGLFQVLTEREARAIVDRLTYGGNVIEVSTHSYRVAQTRSRHDSPPTTNGSQGRH